MIVSNFFEDLSNNAFLISILNTCFILAFSVYMSPLFVTMEYALLNKEETTPLPCNFFGSDSFSIGICRYV